MPHYDYNLDKRIADVTEQYIVDYCNGLFGKLGYSLVSHEINHTNSYDIKLYLEKNKTSLDITFEVKEDFTCERTGNIGVEFHCRGKPSGISVSQSNFYWFVAHEMDGRVCHIVVETSKLKTAIKENKFTRTVNNAGDYNSMSKCYLFKLDTIKEIAILRKYDENFSKPQEIND